MAISLRTCPIAGAYIVADDGVSDERGSFIRGFCAKTFERLGLPAHFPQHNISANPAPHTLRGLHWQAGEPPEYKLVRCVAGRIWDVAVDMRRQSPTFGKWWGCELAGDGKQALFIPAGCAHGFITLAPDSTLYYLMGCDYRKQDQRGLRFDDPDLSIGWPATPAVISQRDRQLPLFRDLAHE